MSKGYELADGSWSTDYEIGDEFVRTQDGTFIKGSKVTVLGLDFETPSPLVSSQGIRTYSQWNRMEPTEETKLKVKKRKCEFTIGYGDFIDSYEFSRGDIEIFCELAVACGIERDSRLHLSNRYIVADEVARKINAVDGVWVAERCHNDLTKEFREFLDKEKGMKQFTKNDLKDGMRVEYRDGNVRYVIQSTLAALNGNHVSQGTVLSGYNEDLTSKTYKDLDIVKVVDRDGTVEYQREEEPRELTLEEIAEQFNLPVDRIRIKK